MSKLLMFMSSYRKYYTSDTRMYIPEPKHKPEHCLTLERPGNISMPLPNPKLEFKFDLDMTKTIRIYCLGDET